MDWTIKGDPAVTVTTVDGVTYGLNDTVRTFEEMNLAGWTLKFQNLADDVFTYTVRTRNAKGLGAIVPRDGQEISVFYDGVRKFKGTVIRPRLGLDRLSVTAYGPWWWMSKIALSGESTDATDLTADRTSYVFPTQSLRTSLRTLINRAADMGVPMAKINNDTVMAERISGMFTMLKTTLSNMSFAAAFAELMSMVPDAVAWVDYENNPPAIRITRRSAMTAISYPVGGTGSVRVESAEIYPRSDSQVQRVELKFVKRQPVTGKIQWAAQNHGTLSTDTHKRQVQIITISGPETLELVPKDDFDSVTIQTEPISYGIGAVMKRDPVIVDAIKKYGALKALSSSSLTVAGWHRLLSGEATADWLRTDYNLSARDVRVTGWINCTYNTSAGSGGYGPAGTFLKSIGRLTNDAGAGTFRLFVDFTVPAINLDYRTKTTLRKPWDHDFLAPPANLAENLRNAQNWLPWEGPVTIVRPDLDGYNGLQRKFNLTGAHPDYNGMDALVKSVTYEGSRKRVIWELGPPPRTDLGGLVNKLRRSPQDNLIYL
jgi:hypothetical protein